MIENAGIITTCTSDPMRTACSPAIHPEEEAKRFFLVKQWDEVSNDVLCASLPNPFLIEARVLRHYMPAFLVSALRRDTYEKYSKNFVIY